MLEKILRFLEAGFFGGLLVAAALAGFIGGFSLLFRLSESIISRRRPEAEQYAEMHAQKHRLYTASQRERAEYLLNCLKSALQFYGFNSPEWNWVIQKLQKFPPAEDSVKMGEWLDSIWYLLPEAVLPYQAAREIPEWEQVQPYTDEEFERLRELYTQAGAAMIVLNTLLDRFYTLAVYKWDCPSEMHPSETLAFLEEAESTLRSFRVPLP